MKYDTNQIKRARMAQGWSQSHLAKQADLSPSTVSAVERGDFQKPETMKALADALDLNLADLIIDAPTSEERAS